MNAVVLAALVGGAAAVAGSVLAFIAGRRTSQGRIGTSEAAVLWEQAQQMRTELVAQRDKAEQQRDRLIESQTTTVIPRLAAINDALAQIAASLTKIEGATRNGSGNGGSAGRG